MLICIGHMHLSQCLLYYVYATARWYGSTEARVSRQWGYTMREITGYGSTNNTGGTIIGSGAGSSMRLYDFVI